MDCDCPLTTNTGPTLASTCGGASFFMFMGILEYFIRRQCDLEDPCGRSFDIETPNSSYDFVVIGGGSGGGTVASRLSENRNFSVLLIEAGLDEQAWMRVPSFGFNFLNTDLDWKYSTESQDQACLNGKDKKCEWGRPKVLGGCSAVNGMVYMRGSRKDYDNWERMGNIGWSYEEVLPYYIKSENNLQINKMDSGYHGTDGPLTVTQFNYQRPLYYSILDAGKELGYGIVDFNGRNRTGFAIVQTTSKNGSRLSVARAFIRPARNRLNFHVILNSTATKIIFNQDKKAVGVEFVRNRILQRVGVDKEVIVSGGAISSPHILLNSGIGPREDLEAVGVPVVHDLPGVGKNLHNHIGYSVRFTINETAINVLNWDNAMEYLIYRNGPMSGTGVAGVSAMINTKYADPQEDKPDIQLIFEGYLDRCSETGTIEEKRGSKTKIVIVPTLLSPKSKGYVKLLSLTSPLLFGRRRVGTMTIFERGSELFNSDPLSKPKIQPKYLQHPDDVGVLVDGIKFSLRLAETESLKAYGFELDQTPCKNCEHLEFGSDSYWECALKHDTYPEYHEAGTCKMGPESDPLAVVDNELRVKGIQGVRVADTSIMPEVTSGNTNAPAIMIGERAADFIKSSWNAKPTEC